MTNIDWKKSSADLVSTLGLQSAPLAIAFSQEAPLGVPRFDNPFAEPAPDGRTGRVPAGCVFWMEAAARTFTTVAEDHGNCSVGSLTHGLKTLEEVAGNSDVAELLGSGWVTMDAVPDIPTLKQKPNYVTYGPLEETPGEPDVVFIRINAKQAMLLADALPGLRFEGKPQCHIIPIAKDRNEVAASTGCMLSRVRTGMSNNEMTCAIPAGRLGEVVEALKRCLPIENTVAAYASKDAGRFGG
ncbi:MAG TPA: DUF169 domain-containing protein [Blastocatellia bacterium]|nr:DUF169 domain-containing protein [Blastocatellia bacterium]